MIWHSSLHNSGKVMILMLFMVSWAAPQTTPALISEAEQAMREQNWVATRAALESAIAQDSTIAKAFYLLSKVSLELDDLKSTQSHISKALELDGRNEEFRAWADEVQALSMAMSQARRALTTEYDYDKAINLYEKLTTEYPRFANAHYCMGLAYSKAGDLRPASKAFRTARDLNPDKSDYSKALQRLVAGQYNDANRIYKTRDWEGASGRYSMAIELQPSFHQAYLQLARCQRRMDDYTAALRTLDQVISIKPDYISAYIEKGNILKADGLANQAETIYRQAVNIDPSADKAWIGLGAVLMIDNPAEAIVAFETALSNNPKSASAYEYLGEIYSNQQEWTKARDMLKQAVRLKPKDYKTAWRLAVAHNELEEWEAARLAAKKSTELRRTFEYAWYQKGIAEKALGNRQAAIEAYRHAEKGRDASIRKNARFELDKLESGSR